MLVVPGGGGPDVEAQAALASGAFMRLVDSFAQLQPTEGQNPRILL